MLLRMRKVNLKDMHLTRLRLDRIHDVNVAVNRECFCCVEADDIKSKLF